MLHLPSREQRNLVEYELFGIFEFKPKDTALFNERYERFGDLIVEIKHRAINTHYNIWHVEADIITVYNCENGTLSLSRLGFEN